MRKRLGCLICAIVLLCLSAPTGWAKSIQIQENAEKQQLLLALGIVAADFDPAAEMSGMDFLRGLLRLLAIDCSDAELPAYAKSFQIISDEEETALSEKISVETAAKMAVSGLGYGPLAELQGGYPSGYLTLAENHKLLRGVDRSKDILQGSDGVEIWYNMLEVPLCQQIFEGGLLHNAGTLLKTYLQVYTVQGLVTAVKGQTMAGTPVYQDDGIAIDAQYYTANTENPGQFFARNVLAYYREESTDKQILYVRADSGDTTVIDVTTITKTEFSEGKFLLRYMDLRESSFKKTVIPKYIGYNGQKLDIADVDMNTLLDFQYGDVVVIDHNDDQIGDVMLIESYQNYFVSFVGKDVIYDKYDQDPLEFDFENSETIYQFIKNGEAAQYTDIAENNVLSVYESGDGKVIRVYISDNSVRGKISAIEKLEDRDGCKVIINYFPYYTSLDASGLAPGDTTVFYTDIRGLIAGYSENDLSRSMEYGYMAKMYIDETDETMHFKIFTRQDGMLELRTADSTLKVRHGRISGRMEAQSVRDMLSRDGKVQPQLIRFSSKGDEIITQITIAAEFDPKEDYFQVAASEKAQYGKNKIGNYAVDAGGGTWILAVPPADEITDAQKYTSNYTLTSKTTYNYTAYDIDDFYMAKALVIQLENTDRITNSVALDRGSELGVIEKLDLVEAYNEEEEKIEQYWEVTMGCRGGVSKVKVKCSPQGLYVGELRLSSGNVTIENHNGQPILRDTTQPGFLTPGDVGQFVMNDGLMVAFRRWYRAEDNTMPVSDAYMKPGYCIAGFGGDWTEGTFCYAQVKKMSNKFMLVDCTNKAIDSGYSLAQYLGVSVYPINPDAVGYIFDREKQKVETAAVRDIRMGDDIVFNYVYYNLVSFVVLR